MNLILTDPGNRYTLDTLREVADIALNFANNEFIKLSKNKTSEKKAQEIIENLLKHFGDEIEVEEKSASMIGINYIVGMKNVDFELQDNFYNEHGHYCTRLSLYRTFNPEEELAYEVPNNVFNLGFLTMDNVIEFVDRINKQVPKAVERGNEAFKSKVKERKQKDLAKSTITTVIMEICKKNNIKVKFEHSKDYVTAYFNLGRFHKMEYEIEYDKFNKQLEFLVNNLAKLNTMIKELGHKGKINFGL